MVPGLTCLDSCHSCLRTLNHQNHLGKGVRTAELKLTADCCQQATTCMRGRDSHVAYAWRVKEPSVGGRGSQATAPKAPPCPATSDTLRSALEHTAAGRGGTLHASHQVHEQCADCLTTGIWEHSGSDMVSKICSLKYNPSNSHLGACQVGHMYMYMYRHHTHKVLQKPPGTGPSHLALDPAFCKQ